MTLEIKWLSHQEDVRPISLVLLFFLYQVVVFTFTEDMLLAFWLVAIPHFFLQIPISSSMHIAIHTPIFRIQWADFLFGILYCLENGFTRTCFKLDHLTHHKHYLDQDRDTNAWKRQYGVIGRYRFSFYNLVRVYPSTWRLALGKGYRLMVTYLSEVAVVLSMLIFAVCLDPAMTVMVFIYPMICGVFSTYYWGHHQHAGLDSKNHFSASRTYVSPVYNWLAFNVGYHAAHHYRPDVHWVKLPQLHQEIQGHIPEHLIIKGIPWFSSRYGG